MKAILTLLIVCITSSNHAQEWRKFHRSELGLTDALTSPDYLETGRHFRINPYDNSLWMATQYTVQTIGSDGAPQYFRENNDPAIVHPYRLASFEFLPNKVFILDEFNGIYLYENGELSMVYSPSGLCNGITTSGDSLYVIRNNQPMGKWINGVIELLFNTGTSKRIIVKNNLFWLADNFGYGGLFLYDNLGSQTAFNYSLRMDPGNFDFKFSPHNDTLYVAGNKGLSMLHNLAFFDSIAPDNTTNMPAGIILDFEFDTDDNIWALFGSDGQTPTSVAHYDQQTKTWDSYYDADNSELGFESYCSIEMDNLGNLWMVNNSHIHVLELADLPIWLSVKKQEMNAGIYVYPNPAADLFQIQTDDRISEMYLAGRLGKRVKTFDPKEQEFSIAELPPAVYFLEIVNEYNERGIVKLVKH